MARFVLFLILLVPLTVAGNWLLNHPGQITLDWFDYHIEIHTALAVLLLALVCLAAVLLALGLWQLATWPDRRRARRRYRTLSKGLSHLTHGMTALALGHEGKAEAALQKARLALPGEPLPQLLTAQLLQRQGKEEQARSHFRALLAHASTAELATHRLIEQHLLRREWAEAAALADDARRDTPRDRWLTLTLIDLYARMQQPSRILALTEGWFFNSPLTREERHHYAAIGHAIAAQTTDNPRARLTALRHAYGYAPEFLPTTIAYAESLSDQGEFKRARKILRGAWQQASLPVLIAPILHALGTTPPKQQLRLLKPFMNDSHAAQLLLAEQAVHVGDYARATEAAQAALAQEESKQACALMAEAEKQLHGTEAASVWLARAMDAPSPAGWICHQCGTAHAAWQPHCNGCDRFDTLMYERPEARITSVEITAR